MSVWDEYSKKFGNWNKASFIKWRDRGEINFVLHPNVIPAKRRSIKFRIPVYNKQNDEWYIRTILKNYDRGGVTDKFLNWLENDNEIDMDDVILMVKAGDITEEYKKGDLIGATGYSWKKQLFKPRSEFIYSVIDLDEGDCEWEFLGMTWKTGEKLKMLIKEQIKENGTSGNPWKKPYSFKLTFNPKSRGSDMYAVYATRRELREDVCAAFDQELSQTPEEFVENYYNSNEDSCVELLKKMLVVECPDLGLDIQKEEVKEQVYTENNDENKGYLVSTLTRKNIGDIFYDDKGNKLEFLKFNEKSNKAFFEDDEGIVTFDADFVVYNYDSTKQKVEDIKTETTIVMDCLVGQTYKYDDNELVFVKYNLKNGKGYFENSDGDLVVIKGVDEIEVLSGGVKEVDKVEIEKTDKVAPEVVNNSEYEYVNDEDGEVKSYCPRCNLEVDDEVVKCPHCECNFEIKVEDIFQ